MVDIMKVGKRRKVYPNIEDKEFCDLHNYITIAKKIIATEANKIKPGLYEIIMKDEDALSFITHEIIMADWLFNGNGNYKGYRKQRAIWAIKKYLCRRSKNLSNKNSKISLDKNISMCNNESSMYSVLNNDCLPPDIKAINNEEIQYLYKLLNCLNQKDRDIISKYFFENMTLTDIGKKYNVTKQRVQQIIHHVILELREIACQ